MWLTGVAFQEFYIHGIIWSVFLPYTYWTKCETFLVYLMSPQVELLLALFISPTCCALLFNWLCSYSPIVGGPAWNLQAQLTLETVPGPLWRSLALWIICQAWIRSSRFSLVQSK